MLTATILLRLLFLIFTGGLTLDLILFLFLISYFRRRLFGRVSFISSSIGIHKESIWVLSRLCPINRLLSGVFGQLEPVLILYIFAGLSNFLEFLTEFLFHLIAGTNIKHTITIISAYLKQSIFTNQSSHIGELEVRERIANLIKYKLIFESIDTYELTRLGRLIKQHGIAYKSYTRFYNDLTNEQWDANRFVDHEIIDGHGILKSNGDYINLVIFQKIHLKKKNKYKINKIEGECVGPFYRIW